MELLTIRETAEMLRVSQITVRRYIASGELPAHRVGRGIRVRRQDVEDFLEPVMPGGKPFTMNDPLWDIVGTGRPEGPNYVAGIKSQHRADAHLSSIHDPEDDADPDERRVKPFTRDDPESDEEMPTLREQIGNIIGIGRSSGPTDVSANKYKYLAEAYESDRG